MQITVDRSKQKYNILKYAKYGKYAIQTTYKRSHSKIKKMIYSASNGVFYEKRITFDSLKIYAGSFV